MIHRGRALRSTLAVFSLLLLVAGSAAFAGNGPPSGTIYAHDVAYRTIGTPTDLPDHGKFDTIYVLGGDLAAVSESAPGDADYNGGRWEARPVEFLTIPPTQYTNAEQILAAAADGEVAIGDVVRRFECPLIRK